MMTFAMTTRWIIGLGSGSSADGVDAALLEIEGSGLDLGVHLLRAEHQSYPHDMRDLLRCLGKPGQGDLHHLALLHRLLGETFAAAARQVAERASVALPKVQDRKSVV